MTDTVPQGLSIDGVRASKRIGLAKAKTMLLDLTGLDEASGMVDGFRLKAHRNIYDDDTAKVSVESPTGMYLAVFNGTRIQTFSSESDSGPGAPTGYGKDNNGYEILAQYAPSRFQICGLQAEGADTLLCHERQPGGPYENDDPLSYVHGSATSTVTNMVGTLR